MIVYGFIPCNLVAMMGPTGKKMEGFGNSPSQPASMFAWIS